MSPVLVFLLPARVQNRLMQDVHLKSPCSLRNSLICSSGRAAAINAEVSRANPVCCLLTSHSIRAVWFLGFWPMIEHEHAFIGLCDRTATQPAFQFVTPITLASTQA